MDTTFENITLQPIGMVRNNIKQPFIIASEKGLKMREGHAPTHEMIHKANDTVSEVVLNSDLAEHLDGIEEFSHITILYWAHGVPREACALKKIRPRGNPNNPPVGLFCTRSPARPNPILTTVARLVGREGTTLKVTGLDAIDGSPVLDIKPCIKEFYPTDNVKIPVWMEKIRASFRHEKTND
ncbi:tRNA (N6-threonylcarbamoyladenosine(37)-N6)-methyltransferase TrmO [Methanococcus maripaludis]|uniref:tRNA-Thr(GGU) m(6)t(6)A37 methyltransferase TsaA n=2 Tax=Methanococcus maripaludis TaxID=39152 RepID=A0A7J9PN74_METMI|nr:tRNA (N6-threonylcarbamoyladenosine(37)-N6)-methyltransferase TrmO [Methanococcus maripaludis]MBA2862949.1 tRNA-Thr(GGU) m(6)t(6)A37 methyltransferase TsaA [Methanococcus maripaludis]